MVAKADSDGDASLEIPHDVASSSVLEDDVFYACDDQTWWKRQLKRRDDRTEAGFSVDEWCSKVRSLRMEEVRTFVVLLCSLVKGVREISTNALRSRPCSMVCLSL